MAPCGLCSLALPPKTSGFNQGGPKTVSLLALNQLEKTIAGRVLFKKVQLPLESGKRYGLVGANGSGKSTLLRILAGQEEASSGDVTSRSGTTIGFLEQDFSPWLEWPILDVAMTGQPEAFEALRALDSAEHGDQQLDEAAYAKHQDVLASTDGYTLAPRAAQILEGLGIPAQDHNNALHTLSGGYRLRVLLAKTLIGNPDVLLLDEPTNHLDLMAIHWLENFLSQYRGCLLLVSHDHTFLLRVCSDTLDVDYETITHYPGDYNYFLSRKAGDRETREKEIAKREKEIAHREAFISRFKAKASKARQAQSRVKQVEKIKIEPLPQSSRRAPNFSFAAGHTSGKEILRVKNLCKSFNDKSVIQDLSIQLRRGTRLAVVGPNGVGKSTFINCLVNELEPSAGSFEWGHNVQWGHYSQDPLKALKKSADNLLDWLWQKMADQSETVVRSLLGQMLFSSDDVKKKVQRVSGGEAARLQFAWLTQQRPNILLLDEPTNHLDMEAIEALEAALSDYDGSIIFVSHHRHFLSALATEVLELKWDGAFHYPGDYDSFTQATQRDYLAAGKRTKTPNKAPDKAAPTKMASNKRPPNVQKLKKDQAQITAQIEQIERRLQEIQDLYLSPDFHKSVAGDAIQALSEEESQLNNDLEEKMLEWERVSSLLEEHYPNH